MTTYSASMTVQQQKDLYHNAVKILSKWNVDAPRICRILRMDVEAMDQILYSVEEESFFTEDQIRRFDLVVNFDRFINILFKNPANREKFASYSNANIIFKGRSLLKIMEECDTEEWQRVYLEVKIWAINPW